MLKWCHHLCLCCRSLAYGCQKLCALSLGPTLCKEEMQAVQRTRKVPRKKAIGFLVIVFRQHSQGYCEEHTCSGAASSTGCDDCIARKRICEKGIKRQAVQGREIR